MKKICLIMCVLLINGFAIANEETVPVLFDSTGGIMFDYAEDNNSLINYESMKKADKIETFQKEDNLKEKKKPIIKFDTREINHQRALNYSTKQNNSIMLPTF